MTATPVLAQTPKITPVNIVNGTGTGVVTAATAGSNGSKVVSVTITSTDTSARVVQLNLTRSATNYLLASANVAAASGTDGVTTVVNMLASATFPGLPVDNDGQSYIFLQSGDTLTVGSTTTVTSGKTITVATVQADF